MIVLLLALWALGVATGGFGMWLWRELRDDLRLASPSADD